MLALTAAVLVYLVALLPTESKIAIAFLIAGWLIWQANIEEIVE